MDKFQSFFKSSIGWVLLIYLLIHSQAVSSQSITWVNCPLSDCENIPSSTKFGRINVPLSYNVPESDSTSITFTVIKAKVEGTDKSPLLFFQGNWKGESLDFTPIFQDIFQIYDRDIILFDERFTGYSGNSECEWVGKSAWKNYRLSTSLDNFLADQSKLYTECIDSLEFSGIRPHQFARSTKTRDVIMLAKKLGYVSYNLMGVSNGTRAVQMFIQESDSASINVRSVILDSPVPLGKPLLGEYLATYHAALVARLESVQQQGKYHDIMSNWSEAITIKYGEMNFELTPYKVSDLLESQLYHHDQTKNIEVILDAVQNKQWPELHPFISNLQTNYLDLDAHFIVDILSFQKEFRDANLRRHTYLKDSLKTEILASNFGSLKFYETTNSIEQDPIEAISIKSDIPAFILVGEYDPVTPNRIAKPLRFNFINNYYLIVPGAGHGVAYLPYVVPQLKSFLENPDQFIINSNQ